MKNVKYVYFDLDGTLIPDGKTLSDKIIKSINYLQSKGIKIGIATGRCWAFTILYAIKLKTQLPIICNDGALIVANDFKTFTNFAINKDTQSKVINFLKLKQVPLYCLTLDSFYCFDKNHLSYQWANQRISEYITNKELLTKFTLNVVTNYDFYLNLNALKINTWVKDTNVWNQVYEYVNNFKDLYIFIPPHKSICIYNNNVTKASAILKVINKLKIDKNQVCVFGDDVNDVSMLNEFYPNSVVLSNGLIQAKKVANYITEYDCFNNGVADFIYKYF